MSKSELRSGLVGGALIAIGIAGVVLPQYVGGGAIPGLLLVMFGVTLAFNRTLVQKLVLELSGGKVTLELPAAPVNPKNIPDDVRKKREEYVALNPPPGAHAPTFNALSDSPQVAAFPAANPMVPVYMLDNDFRIVDWNEAFSIAYDRSMEGRRGQSALEWVYLLDNFKESLNHAREKFPDPKNLPAFDKETLKFTSSRFGRLVATKRAYRIPNDEGGFLGWMVALDTEFADFEKARLFNFYLIRNLARILLWTEYALSYDELLTRLNAYDEMIQTLLGERGSLPPVPKQSRVLDLGAGTGNISHRLSTDGRFVVAMDNNPAMLSILRQKCKGTIRNNDESAGTMVIKQDIHSLNGIPDNYFDVVVASNVLYSLDDPQGCLSEIFRVLKPGGEVRVSGPTKKVDVDLLFKRFKTELVKAKQFAGLEFHFEQARKANLSLEADLVRWSSFDVESALINAGFPGVTRQETYYFGQGRIVYSDKPKHDSSD